MLYARYSGIHNPAVYQACGTRVHTYAHAYIYVHTRTKTRARARKHPSNNPQSGLGSRNARALISPGVFSSTGSRPWISTIRLVQRQPRREFRFLRKPPDSIRACGFEMRYYNTPREYKPTGETLGETAMRLVMAIPLLCLAASSLFADNRSNPARPSSPAIHQRRERGV